MTDGAQRPLRLLSLDGGGIRGLSSLIILQHIMSGVNASRSADDQLQPWQAFDMIGGTSTGGIIAIMLGRLRMSLDECEDAYLKLSKRIFQPKRRFAKAAKAADYLQANGRFDSKKLEEVIKEYIASKTDEDALLKDTDPQCKVFVCTARANNSEPALLRSYHNPKMAEVLFNECRIWEACRATSAATTFFDPITFGRYGQTFVDGAVLYNNPVQLVQREASQLWPGRKVVMISVGTGAAPSKSFEGNLLAIVRSMKSILTQTERTANDFYHANPDMATDGRLFRFNVSRGLENIGLEEWKEIGAVVDATQSYLDQAETNEKLESCVERLSRQQCNEGNSNTDFLALLAQQNLEAERRALTEWLSPLNFFVKQADVLGLRVEGTGQWLLESEQFKSWVSGSKKTLWCSGIPGAGKTVLASIVVDHLQKSFPGDDTGIAFAYCNHQERIKQTPVNLIGSLLKQLAQARPLIYDRLKPLYKKHQNYNTCPTLSEISTALRDEIAHYSNVFVIIDALDECPEHNGFRDTLLMELGSLSRYVKLLVTSRPHISIEYDIEGAIPLEIQASDGDLRKYLQDRLARSHRLMRYVRPDDDLKRAIIDTVLGNARGMFLLAQLHMDLIATKATQNEVRKALENLPQGLDESYKEALRRIESQNHDDCQRAKRTLYWISHALRPLTVAELQSALAVMPGGTRVDHGDLVHQDIILSICAGLVVIDSESSVFRLVHFSAMKFFESIRAAIFPDAQADLASTCLTYISFETFAGGPCPTNEQLESRLRENPLFMYASQHWGNHLRGKPEQAPNTTELALEFFNHKQKVASSVQVTFTSKADRTDWSQEFPTGVEAVQLAARFGLKHIIELLIEQGADVCSTDSDGTTALHEAATIGHTELVSLLVASGADIAATTTTGVTALCNAIVGGHDSTALCLLDSGDLNLEVVDAYNGAVIHTAAYNGDTKAMELLLNRGADVTATAEHGNTALHIAAFIGNQTLVKMLVEKSAPINTKNLFSLTPLHYGAHNAHEEVVALLLQNSADIGVTDNRGSTPVHMAADGGSEAIVKLLLDHGADLNARSTQGCYNSEVEGLDELVVSFLSGDWEMGPFLRDTTCRDISALHRTNSNMKRGAHVQNWLEGSAFGVMPTLTYGGSPLNCAAFRGNANVVQLLLERGADPASKDDTKTPAMWRAAAAGHDAVVTLLLEHGVDVNIKDEGTDGVYDPWIVDQDENRSYQGSALSRAVHYDHPTTVRLLLKWGAETEIKDSNSATALHHAVGALSDLDNLHALLEYKADIEAKDSYGATPVLRAAFARAPPKIQALLDAGADVRATNDTGMTALHMVVESEAVHCTYEYNDQCDHCDHCDAGRETIALLLKHGLDLEARDLDDNTPLFLAAEAGLERISRALLDHGANVDVIDETGSPLLQRVVQGGHVDVIRLLCEKNVNLEVTDQEEFTALYWATWSKNIEVVQLLIESGASVNETTEEFETSLQMAISDDQEAIVRLLLTKADRYNKVKALIHAASLGSEKYAQIFLEAGVAEDEKQLRLTEGEKEEAGTVDDNASTQEYETAAGVAVIENHEAVLKLLLAHDALFEEGKLLKDAVLLGHDSIAKLLLDRGVSIEARHGYGCSALHTAAGLGNEDAIRFLLDNGSDPTAEQLVGGDKGGPTALFWGANGGHNQCVQILLDAYNPYTMDATIDGRGEEWALHAASINGHDSTVALLLDRGADMEAKFDKGVTVLSAAAAVGHEGVVKMLLQRGANRDATDQDGVTAAEYAAKNGHDHIAAILKETAVEFESVSEEQVDDNTT